MVNKSSIRSRNKSRFRKCVELRKQGLSYSEIRKIVPVAKSTLQNWLTFAGLTLTKTHLEIQTRKRIQNRRLGTEASRLTRQRNMQVRVLTTARNLKNVFSEPLFITGIMLYEAEGSKKNECRFSNSDYRLHQIFIKFLKKYFLVDVDKNLKFSLFIHKTRRRDLNKITGFWIQKLGINPERLRVYWKKNKVKNRRNNPEYVGQIQVIVSGIPLITRKLLTISDIILRSQLRK